ncbi:hypothetical protein GOHSU_22_00030 [Gordonia hirsuta DSM 44140 = NBRC 16056]|uniref:DUF732 domain-containing protein n=1 Tax=Gordonia hirsuta DSM 44140 = NBRC 16056 TaxID=1121927 RepID=L7LBZ4_9ACTN|nr:hypothetical protein [Gordonia hirsuta]GAC57543.1 hypothetical protein GOHSU_22_00030 [Gordonia hirsuta DSM 44140 = NBRC 16056]
MTRRRRWVVAGAAVLPLTAMLLVSTPAQAFPQGLVPGAVFAGGIPNTTVVDTDDLAEQQKRTPPGPQMQKDVPGPLPADEMIEPGAPMPVPNGAFGYLATRNATLWLAAQRPGDAIRALPVPPQYRAANDALARQMGRELTAAVRTPGACLQIIIDPHSSAGNLFDYGVWSVDRQYCPRS